MSYVDALTRLARLPSNQAVRQSLAVAPLLNQRSMPEMRAWLQRAGHSEADLARLRCIHVAGSKGKGTVCGYASSLLQAWKRYENKTDRVGLYTSPHVVSVRERIALDGQPLSQVDFARYFFEVYDAIRDSQSPSIGPPEVGVVDGQLQEVGPAQDMPSFFGFLTIMAFHVFLREGVTDAVVECGIGGEYDATNVLPPAAVSTAVITSISLEHSNLLGNTISEIAAQKAGIIKPGVALVTSVGSASNLQANDAGVRGAIWSKWLEAGGNTTLVEVQNSMVDEWVKRDFGIRPGKGKGWNTPNLDATNKALAVAAALVHTNSPIVPRHPLRNLPPWLTQSELKYQRASLRARREKVFNGPAVWLVDGAHTEHSLCRLGEYFTRFVGPRNRRPSVIVYNQQDVSRPPEELIRGLLKHIKNPIVAVVCTRNEVAPPEEGEVRDLSVQTRARDVFVEAGYPKVHVTDNVTAAVAQARSYGEREAANKDKSCAYVLVTGSFHLAGSALQVVKGAEEEL